MTNYKQADNKQVYAEQYRERVDLVVDSIKITWGALINVLWYIVTETADKGADIAARALALLAPFPNAVSVYNISQHTLGYTQNQAFAFAATLELALFAIIEVALLMWDGWLRDRKRYTIPLVAASIAIVAVLIIVVTVVYNLEVKTGGHWVLALLPFVSLFSFVALGLKRWNERNTIVPEVGGMSTTDDPANDNELAAIIDDDLPHDLAVKNDDEMIAAIGNNDVIDDTIERRKRFAEYCKTTGFQSLQIATNHLGYSNKTVARNDLLWLEKQGIVHVDRAGKSMAVTVNGKYESFVNG